MKISNIFMALFVALGAILMVCFYFIRALLIFLPIIVIVALIIMVVYSIKKNRKNGGK